MPDPRPCCILGVCCPPGSEAQKADMKAWLEEKLGEDRRSGELGPATDETAAGAAARWIDELFAKGAESA